MKNFFLSLVAALSVAVTASATNAPNFTVDQYLAIPIEYAAPRVIVGVDTFGPTSKAELCTRGLAAMIAQAHDKVEPGHVLIGTCLHIVFRGPLGPHGAVATPKFSGTPLGYILIAVMYGPNGEFVGARPLHGVGDATTCQKQARDLIDSNVKSGNAPSAASLLIYCLPVPVLPTAERLPDRTQSV